MVSIFPVTRPSVLVSQTDHSVPPDHGLFELKLSAMNSRRTLISEKDARHVNLILFITKPLNQFVGEWCDFALQIRGQLAKDFPPRVNCRSLDTWHLGSIRRLCKDDVSDDYQKR